MASSGVHRRTVELDLVHDCEFQGLVEWEYDPEVDPSNIYTDCPKCGREVREAA